MTTDNRTNEELGAAGLLPHQGTEERRVTQRIDHAAEARKILEATESARDAYTDMALSHARVHATLALVEQQRIANRIALASTVAAVEMKYMQHGCRDHLLGETGLFDRANDPERAILKPEIKEGLGL